MDITTSLFFAPKTRVQKQLFHLLSSLTNVRYDQLEQTFYFMQVDTRQKILQVTRHEFAKVGYEGISMRALAKAIGIAPSVFYHYFADKDSLLLEVYLSSNRFLAEQRLALPRLDSFEDTLKQRIEFQFVNAEAITAVLKYYLHYRHDFKKNVRGHLPEKSYLHIEEVLQFGENTGLYVFPNLQKESKIIVHAINGFILEYFPSRVTQTERQELVATLSDFISRALAPYQVKKRDKGTS